jgi:hypothetical protein
VQLAGPYATLGASQAIRLRPWLDFVPRLTAGVLIGQVRDPVIGTATTTGATSPVDIPGAGDSITATRVFIAPELGLLVRWRGLEFGAGASLAFFPGTSAAFDVGEVLVPPNCTKQNAGAVGCAPAVSLLSGERSLGPFYVIVPTVSGSYAF